MKKCIHCGISIKGSAVAFCPKCKKPLKKPAKKRRPFPNKPNQQPQSTNKPANLRSNSLPVKKIPQVKKIPPQNIIFRFRLWLSVILDPKKNQKPDMEPVSVISPVDENYDGYYDDKSTDDNSQNKETFEPELIKRIIFISCGAIIFIVFAIILMNLL